MNFNSIKIESPWNKNSRNKKGRLAYNESPLNGFLLVLLPGLKLLFDFVGHLPGLIDFFLGFASLGNRQDHINDGFFDPGNLQPESRDFPEKKLVHHTNLPSGHESS